MEAGQQVRVRDDKSLYNFTVESELGFPPATTYTLNKQYWLIESRNKKQIALDGIGPMRLVRNKIAYAAYPISRSIIAPPTVSDDQNRMGSNQRAG